MKKVFFVVVIMAFIVALLPSLAVAHTEEEPMVVDLLAGQTMDVGDVKVWNSEETLFVQFEYSGPECGFLELHLQVDEGEFSPYILTRKGNPIPGQFEMYYVPGDCFTAYTFELNLADEGFEYEDGLVIAAHAALGYDELLYSDGESAWACGLDNCFDFTGRNWATYFTYAVQEPPIPTPGEDIVVFNDINPFDNEGMTNANNDLMVANLVNYINPNPRGAGTVVWFDRGRASVCAGTGECNNANLADMRTEITSAGYSIVDITSTSGSITSIPADVKVITLWNPMVPYTVDEINTFKQFADEGGRLVFIGEWDDYYGAGIALENQFLLDMGAVMTNIGDAVDCGYTDLPGASLRPHQITTGMTGVRIACASVIVPGPEDYPFLYDSTNTKVLAGVAKIDTTPLP